jgi:hypothetical protein
MPRLNVPQAEFLSLPHKYRALVAGFGTGKTWGGCASLCKHVLEWPNINSAYYAPTYSHIRDIFYPTIEEVAEDWGLRVKIRSSDKEVDWYIGDVYRSTTKCRSMDNPNSIIGYKSGHSLIDEFDTLPTDKALKAWRKIIARMRYRVEGLRNGVDVATTPEGFKATYQLFVEQLEKDPSLSSVYGLIHASTYDNELNLPDDYIDSLISSYPQELRDAYLNGQFTNLTSGTVYRNYSRKTCASNEVEDGREPLFIGMDFNVENMAATVYVKRDKVWHAVDEFSDYLDTPDMVRAIDLRYSGRKIYIYPDASGKNRKSTGANTSDIAILKQAGFTVRATESNPPVRDRINATNKALADGIMKVNHAKCPKTAKCLEQQAYNKNGEPDKSGGQDHQNDATTYPIVYEMPITKPYSAGAKVRMF